MCLENRGQLTKLFLNCSWQVEYGKKNKHSSGENFLYTKHPCSTLILPNNFLPHSFLAHIGPLLLPKQDSKNKTKQQSYDLVLLF